MIPSAPDKFSPRRAWLFASPFLLMGTVALVLALYGVLSRQLNLNAAKHLLTIVVVCAGASLLIIGWFATKRTKPAVLLKARHADKPWMWRPDWAAGRVDNDLHRSIFFLWIFVIFFNLVALGVGGLVVLRAVGYGNGLAWLGLLIPGIGLAVLGFALRTTRAWQRFGRTVLQMTSLPVAPGTVLRGTLRVPVRLQPEHAFYLRLSCVRSTNAMRGKTRVTTERILWQEEKWFQPNLPQTEMGATCLPVHFSLPATLPETAGVHGDGVQWRLEASAKVNGPDFHAHFEIPVYLPVAFPASVEDPGAVGSAPAVAPMPVTVDPAAPDPSLPWQLTLDQIRQEIQSRITVNDTAEGRELIFPAGRNPGFASGAAMLWVVWTVAVVAMICFRAPLVFPLVFAAVDALMSIFVADLWFRRSRVLVTPTQVKLLTAWLMLKKEQVIPVADVATLKAEIGATAGHAVYYDLKIKTRSGQEYVAAKNLSHKPEADWLIRQLAAALKR